MHGDDGDTSRGQATVEFALTLPLIIVVLAAIIQVSSIAATYLDVVNETRTVGRSASLADDPRAAALGALPIGSASQVEVSFDETTVTVVVSRRVDTDLPLVGRFTPTVTLRSQLTLVREPFGQDFGPEGSTNDSTGAASSRPPVTAADDR